MRASIIIVSVIIYSVFILVPIIISRSVLKRRKEVKQETQQTELMDADKRKMAELFVSTSEEFISSLGNGYFLNFISDGVLKNAFAIISNKRVYFRGSCYSGQGKNLTISEENRTVDIKDVTGSGFIYKRRIGIIFGLGFALLVSFVGFIVGFWYFNKFISSFTEYLYVMIERGKNIFLVSLLHSFGSGLLLSLFVSTLIVFINYLKKRKTLFQVQYAGGSIAFDVSYYAKAEIEDFQKQLRRVKDLIEEASAKSVSAPVTVQSQPVAGNNGTADELRKYADLLKDGLISQEDYDAMKKKLLGL